MRIVIFGGSGFLGSHIADKLTYRGHKVIIYDIKKSPYLLSEQKMIVGDILDNKKVGKTIENCDVVYNLAGIADIEECISRSLDAIKYNILGNMVILEALRNANIYRFVFASSIYVYSQSGFIYKSTKQACESFIEDYNKLYGLPYTILRYGSLYGERADERNGIYKLLKDAITTGKIKHFGDGEEVREYIHVGDAADLSVDILQKEYENQHIILTGNQSMKYRDLLEMIKEIFGNTINIEYSENRKVSHYKITPYSFNPKVGYKLVKNPSIDLGQGILNCLVDLQKDE